MNKIKLLVSRATVLGSHGAGEVIEVDPYCAVRMIESGQAEAVDGEKYEDADVVAAHDEKLLKERYPKKKNHGKRKSQQIVSTQAVKKEAPKKVVKKAAKKTTKKKAAK